ncbi:hypothetical protein ACFQS1_13045 [Paractinoplanes rhizophilus]|jgi:hypothetical protein|uniref:TIR domain-containing protein n=1 Tax=Paractinoplanes rhizophilus TaxID=1416877 RepID=A0ABW2HT28_9ACTN
MYSYYLSYGHAPRLRPEDRPDIDHWAGRLHDALTAELALAGVPGGYYDDLSAPLGDWRGTLKRALSVSDVFVALYSPGYFAKAWPLRELASFGTRFADPQAAARFVLPVLWVPWPRWERAAEREAALRLGAGISAYASEGLQALARLSMFRASYHAVVRRLAGRIVAASRTAPRPAPEAVVVDMFPDPVLTVTDLSGNAAVAELAVNVAERLGYPARLAERPGPGAGLVLISDPSALRTPPPEATTVLIVGDERGARGAAELTDSLVAAGVARGRIAVVTDPARLADRLPSIIDSACHAHRRSAPVFPPKGADSSLPVIGGEGHHDR